MSLFETFAQQLINGLSIGAMYALLALGFTMVYGIIELINFSHFNIFMAGSFIALLILEAMGFKGQAYTLTGLPLVGVMVFTLLATMLITGLLGVLIERVALRPMRGVSGTAPMITTIGVSYILFNIVFLTQGANSKNFPNPIPSLQWNFGQITLRPREVLLWTITLLLMVVLNYFVYRTKLGKAMQATAQDQEAARMVGVDVDRVVVTTFFVGSALAGAAGFIFGIYYNVTREDIGFQAGLFAFTAAVLGGIGSIPGAMLGGLLIGLIKSIGTMVVAEKWIDVVVFSVLVLVLMFRPTGLLGTAGPTKS
jgi:branched-chain amino acid transport system permease protein